jgi:microcystin-dependent protein
MTRLCLAATLAILLVATAGAVPEYINYQGRLFDAGGQPIQGSKVFSFSIYDATGEGNMVWGPFVCDGEPGTGHADRIIASDGWFNVILGPADVSGRSILSAFDPQDGKPRFVEIQIEGETISPRQQFLAAPYAMEGYHAAQATQAVYALHGVPPGCILAYYGASAPEGWLLCDGSPIPQGEAYNALRALVGPNTPDLRGRTVLGQDGAANRVRQPEADTVGAAAGEDYHQLSTDEMPVHNHNAGTSGEYKYLLRKSGANTIKYADNTSSEPDVKVVQEIQSRGGDQPHNNMPPYMTVNWIIKY